MPTPAGASPPGPKAGARCANAARRDLSGGPPARAVPTGIAFRRVRRQARRAGLPVEEFAKRATLAYARGGWDFTTNVLDRARWARSHGGHPDPTWPLGEQLAVALVLD